MQYSKDSQQTRIIVQCLEYVSMVHESDVLVVRMPVWTLLLGLPLFHTRYHDIDWAHHGLTSQLSPSMSGEEKMAAKTTALASRISELKYKNVNDQLIGWGPHIQTLGGTTFNNLHTTNEDIPAFAVRIGECTELLESTLEDITMDSPGKPDRRAGGDEQ